RPRKPWALWCLTQWWRAPTRLSSEAPHIHHAARWRRPVAALGASPAVAAPEAHRSDGELGSDPRQLYTARASPATSGARRLRRRVRGMTVRPVAMGIRGLAALALTIPPALAASPDP